MKKFFLFSITLVLIFTTCQAQKKLNTPRVESILYLPDEGDHQPLIVGLGGAEGGNAWASDHWKTTRDSFLHKGYAFLALGYFGAQGTPKILDKIAIEDVYNAISKAAKQNRIDSTRVGIVGGSRGADLALLLASYYPSIRCVVAIVASNVVFPGHTEQFNSSCFTYQGKELPFVPVNDEAVPFLLKHNLREAFEAMLKDEVSEKKALIRVEKINGPILFLSAKGDEVCPSTPMSEKMMNLLDAHHFKFPHEHIAMDGGHSEPLNHFDKVFSFIGQYLK